MFSSVFPEFFRDVCSGVKYISEEEMVTKASSGSVVFSIFPLCLFPILLLAELAKGMGFVNSFCAHLMHISE